MHLAAQEDKVPVAEILVKYGSEIDGTTKAGYTPLHTACHFGQINMVRFLLDHKASVNATTKVNERIRTAMTEILMSCFKYRNYRFSYSE